MNENIYDPNGSSSNIVNQEYISNTTLDTSNIDYLYPRQVGTGSTRGTQTIGVGSINIDGSNDQITITSLDNTSTITLGQELGISSQVGVASSSLGTNAGSFGINITDINNASISLGLSSNGNAQEIFNDGKTNRLLIGQNAAGKEVVWISKPGIEVTTASLPQLSFSSDASYTVLLQSSYTFPSFGSVPADTLNAGSFTTIPHNAGFVPNVNCFAPFAFSGVVYETAPVGFPISDITFVVSGSAITQVDGVSGNAFFNLFYSVDTTNLYIGVTFQNGTSVSVTTLPLTIYYTVFALSATTS